MSPQNVEVTNLYIWTSKSVNDTYLFHFQILFLDERIVFSIDWSNGRSAELNHRSAELNHQNKNKQKITHAKK